MLKEKSSLNIFKKCFTARRTFVPGGVFVHKLFGLLFSLILCCCFPAGAMFMPSTGGNCALPLYMAALQGGFGDSGSKKKQLKHAQEDLKEELKNIDNAIDEQMEDIEPVLRIIGGRIGDIDCNGSKDLDDCGRGHVMDQIFQYMKEGWDQGDAHKHYCDDNSANLQLQPAFSRVLAGLFVPSEQAPPFRLSLLQFITKKSFDTVVPSAGATGGDSGSSSGTIILHCSNESGGVCIDCNSGYNVDGDGGCEPNTSDTQVSSDDARLTDSLGSGESGDEVEIPEDANVADLAQLILAREVAQEELVELRAQLAGLEATKTTQSEQIRGLEEKVADAIDALNKANQRIEELVEGDRGLADEGSPGDGGDDKDLSECDLFKKWKKCAKARGKGEITKTLCGEPKKCSKEGTVFLVENGSGPKVTASVCREAVSTLKKQLRNLADLEEERDLIVENLDEVGDELREIRLAKLRGTEAEDCSECDLRRLREIKEIIDPAPSGWDILGNVVGTVGAAALGYYSAKEANKLRDRQGFAAQPGIAMNLAYPFIMKGLYGGGLFGGSSSLACSPTMFGGGGNVFGNPFMGQQMAYAQQMHYMQQMHLMQSFYGGMPGGGGFVGGGLMPGMGGIMGGIAIGGIPGMGGIMGGGMMPGMGGIMGGGMMPGMGGIMGGIAIGGMSGMGGIMGGGMMPGMGGFVGGIMGGGMMPGMGGGMFSGMMPGVMNTMMPGMIGGTMGGFMASAMGGAMGGAMNNGQAYIQYQQAMLAYQQAQINNYMQKQQAVSGLYSEISRLQMQIQQVMYGGAGNYNLTAAGGGGDASTGGGGTQSDDDKDTGTGRRRGDRTM